MIFHDDDPVECCMCGDDVYAPGDYLYYNKEVFCSEECFGKYLVERTSGIETIHLSTKYENEMDYGDYLYHRQEE